MKATMAVDRLSDHATAPYGIDELVCRLHELASSADASALDEVLSAVDRLSNLPEHEQCERTVVGLLTATRYCYLSQRTLNALEAGRAALEQAKRLGQVGLLRRALTYFAVMQAENGNLLDATKLYSEAALLAQELGEPNHIRPVLNNLALLFINSGQYAEALRCLMRAADLPKGSSDCCAITRSSLATSYLNITHCCMALKRYKEGVEAAESAARLLRAPTTAEDCLNRAIAEVNLGRISLESGDVGLAENRLELAAQFAGRSRIPKARHSVALLRGLIDVKVGRTELGLEQLRAVLAEARKSIPAHLPDTLAACVSSFDSAGRSDAALGYLYELFAIQKHYKTKNLKQQIGWLGPDSESLGDATDESQIALSSTAARLGKEVQKKIQYLSDTAASAANASGYDLRRTYRVAKLAERFGEFECWEKRDIAALKLAAQVADIGMIAVSDRILCKPGPLSLAERRLIEEHTRVGAELLASAHLDFLFPCIEVARFHHERCDGSGPFGLEGGAIPLFARVVGLCDTFDAMTHSRPWRAARTAQSAVREIELLGGNKFDGRLAHRFAAFVREEFWRHDDLDAFLGQEASSSAFVRARESISKVIGAADAHTEWFSEANVSR